MDDKMQRKMCWKAFAISAAGSAVVLLLMHSAGPVLHSRWLEFGAGLAVCAGALALFGKAWAAAPDGAAVAVWYGLRVLLVFGAVVAALFLPWLDPVGVLVPQLFSMPALAVLMALDKKR